MNYKSFTDLSRDITRNLGKVPKNVDLVVGIPRSGLMAASILALSLNLKFCDLASFTRNNPLTTGRTREARGGHIQQPFDATTVLIVDDTVDSGGSIRAVKSLVQTCAFAGDVIYMAIYATPGQREVDIYLEEVRLPRMFEWNLFHRPKLEQCCVDMDGILCFDPTTESNDDGEKYVDFLSSALPLIRPSYKIGHIVTSRLEKYRRQTAQWLETQGIRYGQLHMLDLPSAAERRILGCHASFKADVYRSIHDSPLFIESESQQAIDIARRSGKPVLDFSQQVVVRPNFNLASVATMQRSLSTRIRRRIKGILNNTRLRWSTMPRKNRE